MSDIHAWLGDAPRPTLADPWHRLKARWRNGGVEEYSLGQSALGRTRVRMNYRIELTRHRISIHGLPEPFRGFSIVQLTDIHHGLYFPSEALASVIEMTNRLEPDIIAITGDFVTRSRNYIEPAAALLGQLRAKHGVFAVLGNHDFRVAPEEIALALDEHGISVLRNQHTSLRRRGEEIFLAGIDDYLYGADLSHAMRGIPKNAPRILLSHNPAIIESASRLGIDLVLSGHTHGGQVRLPLVGCVYGRSDKKMRFKKGRDRLGRTQIYVSRGIGTVVLPVRYGCPPEVPQLVLEPQRERPRASSEGWRSARPHALR